MEKSNVVREEEARTARFPSAERALFALAGLFVGMNLLAILLQVGIQKLSARGIALSPAFSYAASGAVELLCVGLPAVLWARRGEKRAAGAVRREPLDGFNAALIAAAAVLSVPVMNMIAALWCAMLDSAGIAYAQGMTVPETAMEVVICLLTTAVIAPVCEEEFFRGRLFAALEPYGTRRALGVSAVFFALLHGQIGALPVHLMTGALLGLLLVRRRSIHAAILFHACYNGATVLLAILPEPLFAALMQGALVMLALWMITMAAALRPDARMYTLPGGRRMSETARAMMATLALAFALPYILSILI